ncbi:PEP-CTERM sorting domain-containing protein [Alteromonas pelagimontana]|uniref:PEP-CTERM sorting domain-containing protein n=1 Tax=Alteromonas pelagimontana TaxID=1858656 RepID=A0A6M4MHQ2_9ALTE|nr:PEP-CTERM sorting domain-containing protein [Alteromonas pelagimontana]QJR82150.1 PEP-CTERM sorting domain-containing protein [Alteromonas pelagimontana]
MKIIGKKLAALGLLATVTTTTHGGVISYGEFTREDSSDVVSGLGMDWLQWSSTKGMSINSALSTYAVDGWRVASVTEMTGLFNYFVPSYDWVESESFTQQTSTGWSDELNSDTETDVQFQTLFGYTYLARASDYLSGDALNKTEAIFGSDDNNNNYYGLAGLYDDFTVFNGNENGGNAYLNKDTFTTSFSYPRYGIALVRGTLDLSYLDGDVSNGGDEESDNGGVGAIADVSEPTSIAMFAVVGGFLFARRNNFGRKAR